MKNKLHVLAVVAALSALTFSSCQKDENKDQPAPASSSTPDVSEKGLNPDETILNAENERYRMNGYLYTESNGANQNMILCYKQHHDGSLTFESSTPSGGSGAGMPLGSQGALVTDKQHRMLFAVNAGDNSISSFDIHSDGSLTLLHTVSSQGTMPVSLSIHRNHLYVVNAGSDNINGYMVGMGGTLTPVPLSNRPLSGTMTGPAQISFSPNGHYLYVTEKMTNKITMFPVDMNGAAMAHISMPSSGTEPFGFCFARDNYMVVSNANMGIPAGSSCTAYSGGNSGNVSAVNGPVPNHQTAACWVSTTKYGRFAYVTNTGSDNISSYYVSPWGSIYLLHGSAAQAGDAPTDICVAENNYYVYNINSMSHTITGFHRGWLGDLVPMNSINGLPPFAAGLATM